MHTIVSITLSAVFKIPLAIFKLKMLCKTMVIKKKKPYMEAVAQWVECFLC